MVHLGFAGSGAEIHIQPNTDEHANAIQEGLYLASSILHIDDSFYISPSVGFVFHLPAPAGYSVLLLAT